MQRAAHSFLTVAYLTLFWDMDSPDTFFLFKPPALSACVSLVSELMDETKAGKEVAV